MNIAQRDISYSPALGQQLNALKLKQIAENFNDFRLYLRHEMHWNWWTELLGYRLQRFRDKLLAGQRPKMAIMAPPQHGKSWVAEDFVAWLGGCSPQLKTIFASYSDDLGTQRNLNLQRVWQGEPFKALFPQLHVGASGWTCNTSLIEFPHSVGSFRNTTVQSGINGMELNLGVIDDPHKGRAEAMSKTTRDRVWNWFTDDWMARFAKDSGMLIIMTRWHVDDLLGRYLERVPEVELVRFPAIAEQDEFIGSKRVRSAGQALFPAVKPLEFLHERKQLMAEASWQSEYQQHPIVVGGGIFPIDKIGTQPMWDWHNIMRSCRYWDKAGTEDGGAYTAGVLLHQTRDQQYVISHVTRGQWGALERERQIKSWAERDTANIKSGSYEVVVEQEPGSGGKESAEHTIRNLAGYRVYADRVTGSKEARAEPLAAQVQGGNLKLVAGLWNADFLSEMEIFPQGKYRDQCDAASGAFNRIVSGPQYSLNSGWLD